ncbi:hypothetical protein JDV02_008236 [Purpureocillium takamizusanense]|uniref:Uncharacterized protein n=1 Tax=Purpureocillium takamizusanense TaxID=2060973 RepID=A0A9Q8VD41_9HYPO|nr:uncharacterized protein JDV02_008236 [Purpureocillium takamizusanense]UNI22340.1 hypothetical protein JDV02_008236 [Purpureocillium takamizusanense]
MEWTSPPVGQYYICASCIACASRLLVRCSQIRTEPEPQEQQQYHHDHHDHPDEDDGLPRARVLIMATGTTKPPLSLGQVGSHAQCGLYSRGSKGLASACG